MPKFIIALAILLVLVGGGYFLFQSKETPQVEISSNVQEQETMQPEKEVNNQNQPTSSYEVIYTDSGYSPSQIIIKVGDSVTFKNKSSQGMWTASAMHPSHMVYGNTSLQQHCPDNENDDFDECKSSQPGESWSFQFKKTGTFGYHNHVASQHFGKIIVE